MILHQVLDECCASVTVVSSTIAWMILMLNFWMNFVPVQCHPLLDDSGHEDLNELCACVISSIVG